MWRSIKNFIHLLEAMLANALYGFPAKKLKVIAITGTDGKTTTASLLYHILKTAGKNVALISTVAAYIGEEEIDTGFHVTNPSSFALQRLLRKIVAARMEFVILETTSHGIDQNRNWGIKPELAAVTNVTHEHLDYHKTFDQYLKTKAKLLISADHAFLNADAKESFESLQRILKQRKTVFSVVSLEGMPNKIMRVARKRFGDENYNFENVAVAADMTKEIVTSEDIVKAIKTFPGVRGRMEEIPNDRGLTIIVDFAHTPNALEQALKAIRKKMTSGKLIVVFGCAGLRDIGKRPKMGKIAGEHSDLAIFTAEDPRAEDIWTIINQMKSGVTGNHDKIVSIADRYNAIQFAIDKLAKANDTILITGKGHEKSMNLGGKEYDWSDQEAVKKVLLGEAHF